jgi:hypothetical protein
MIMTRDELQEQWDRLPEAEWVRKMKEYYTKTGTYRPEDLRRLLGDPTKGVEMGPTQSMANYFAR